MERVEQVLIKSHREQLWHTDQKILLAVSSGVDSMVLLHLFLSLPSFLRPNIAVAHVNHQLRASSDEEEAFLKQYCADRHIPCFTMKWQEGPYIQKNIEQKARTVRYQFFATIAQQEGYDVVVTAHHADDQNETVLMRWIQGSHLAHLSGIPKQRRLTQSIDVIRPLLRVSKQSLYDYADKYHVPYFEDETNTDTQYLRNQLRQEILPKFQRINPEFTAHRIRFNEQLTYALTLVDDAMQKHYSQGLLLSKQGPELKCDYFLLCDEAVQYFLLNQWRQEIFYKWSYTMTERQLYHIWDRLKQNTDTQIQLNATLMWYKKGNRSFVKLHNEDFGCLDAVVLQLNQCCDLSYKRKVGIFDLHHQPADYCMDDPKWDVWELNDQVCLPITVRSIQSGDKIQYHLAGHHKKVRRIFIDQKVPREWRRQVPICEDACGQIIAVLPYQKSYLSILKETDKIQYRLFYYHF